MTVNEFWHRRLWKFDCALFRDYVTAQGCIAAAHGFAHECSSPDIDPHHGAEKKSHGGSDVYCIGVCRFHHAEAERGTVKFLLRIGAGEQSKIHQRYIEGFLIFIGACGEEIIFPKAKRKAKASTRKNREKKEPYEPPWMKLREPT